MKVLFAAFAFISISLFGQLNVNFIGQLEYNQGVNDIWGYSHYALVGLNGGVSIVDVSNPFSPVEVQYIDGDATSTWRDIKTYAGYAYVVHDGFSGSTDGLQIIDLSDLPGVPDVTEYYFDGASSQGHNIYISGGTAFIMGGSTPGTEFFDLTDPLNPVSVGTYNTYVHDGHVTGNIFWAAQIYQGTLAAVDVSNFASPIVLGTAPTAGDFTHACWNSGNYTFTTDEVSGGYVMAFDVSDASNMFETDRYRTTNGSGVVVHNVYSVGDFVVVSYYTAGIVILDASDPYNLIEVGNYDTSPSSGGGYAGAWGVYPATSGYLYVSDGEEGLIILDPDYIHASYLKGVVTDFLTGSSIQNASIDIIGADNDITQSNILGQYATGIPGGGTFTVQFSAGGYITQEIENVVLTSEETTYLDVQLVPSYPCAIAPNNVTATQDVGNTANTTVAWSYYNPIDISSFDLQYRIVGSSNWSQISNIMVYYYTISGLEPAEEYEFQVKGNCNADVSPWSNAAYYTLDLICTPPNITGSNQDDLTTVSLTWSSANFADWYNYRYKISDAPDNAWQDGWTLSTFVTLTNLEPFESYVFEIQSECSGLDSDPITTIFEVECLPENCNVVDVQVLLEGFLNDGGFLSNSLAEANLIPLNQTFTDEPHEYYGGESLSVIPDDMVDWVLVMLRDPIEPAIIYQTKACYINIDGNIKDVDGSFGAQFNDIPDGDYYVSIHHARHLPVISSSTVHLPEPNKVKLDLMTSIDDVLGTEQLIDIDGFFCMYGGDFDCNGVINNEDYNMWQQNAAVVGAYVNWDADGNGVVNVSDFNLWFKNRSKVGVPEVLIQD